MCMLRYVCGYGIVCQTHAGCSCEYCIRAAFDGTSPFIHTHYTLSSNAFRIGIVDFRAGIKQKPFDLFGFFESTTWANKIEMAKYDFRPKFYRFLWEFRQCPPPPDSPHTTRFTHLNSDTFSVKPNQFNGIVSSPKSQIQTGFSLGKSIHKNDLNADGG